jgi:hypothetical protein
VFTNALQTKKPTLLAAAAAIVFALAVLFAPAAAMATSKVADCTASNGQPGVETAIAVGGSTCVPIGGGGLQGNAIFIYTVSILKVISGLAGLATVGGLLWGGILYITARANASQVEKAKMVMVNSVIGLLLFIFMYAILQFIVPGGVFT